MDVIIPYPLWCCHNFILSLDGLHLRTLDDLTWPAIVLLLSCEEGNKKLVACNLLSCWLLPWSLASLSNGSKCWKLRCVYGGNMFLWLCWRWTCWLWSGNWSFVTVKRTRVVGGWLSCCFFWGDGLASSSSLPLPWKEGRNYGLPFSIFWTVGICCSTLCFLGIIRGSLSFISLRSLSFWAFKACSKICLWLLLTRVACGWVFWVCTRREGLKTSCFFFICCSSITIFSSSFCWWAGFLVWTFPFCSLRILLTFIARPKVSKALSLLAIALASFFCLFCWMSS